MFQTQELISFPRHQHAHWNAPPLLALLETYITTSLMHNHYYSPLSSLSISTTLHYLQTINSPFLQHTKTPKCPTYQPPPQHQRTSQTASCTSLTPKNLTTSQAYTTTTHTLLHLLFLITPQAWLLPTILSTIPSTPYPSRTPNPPSTPLCQSLPHILSTNYSWQRSNSIAMWHFAFQLSAN
jgi:hypothetical protein